MPHLVIIDGHHLMYRGYWAIPRTMKTSKGEQVNAVFGVASMLLQIIRTEQPDSLLFCFDKGDQTVRHQEYAEYKAGRSKTPDDFYTQIPVIFSLIETMGLRSVSDGRYEADDFACAYARMAEKQGYTVTIVSGDRDLLQISSDNIRIAVPHKGYQAPEYFVPAKVKEKFGVTPQQIPAYKGLVGDSSDNYGGVPGIGPKAASALLQTYGSLENMYEHLADIKPSWRLKLEAGKEQAFFCQKMALLHESIPCPVALEDLAMPILDTEQIFRSFADLEFHLLSKRLRSFIDSEAGKKYRDSSAIAQEIFSEEMPKAATKDDSSQLSLL